MVRRIHRPANAEATDIPRCTLHMQDALPPSMASIICDGHFGPLRASKHKMAHHQPNNIVKNVKRQISTKRRPWQVRDQGKWGIWER